MSIFSSRQCWCLFFGSPDLAWLCAFLVLGHFIGSANVSCLAFWSVQICCCPFFVRNVWFCFFFLQFGLLLIWRNARNQILRSPGANRQLFAVGICVLTAIYTPILHSLSLYIVYVYFHTLFHLLKQSSDFVVTINSGGARGSLFTFTALTPSGVRYARLGMCHIIFPINRSL